MKKFLSFILIAAIAVLTGCATSSYPPLNKNIDAKLTILHTNDHHGHFWANRNGEGGLAAQKTLIDNVKADVMARGGSVLLLSAGDINTGVPESDLQDAEPDFKAMSAIGYDAMAIGNHEFDKPAEVLAKQKEWANFPFLGANVLKKGTATPLYDAYKIFDYKGLKVAVFGLLTADAKILSNPAFMTGVDIADPIAIAKKLVPELRQQAHIVIALTHLGFYEGGNYGSNAPGDITLAKNVSGIDVIIGGHSQNATPVPVVENGTIIVQAEDHSKYVGRLDLTISMGTAQQDAYELMPVNLKKKIKKNGKSVRVFIEREILVDQDMVDLLKPYKEKGAKRLGVVIGSTTGDFMGERKVVRSQETNMGNLIARTQRLKAGADLAVMNSGGIRTSIATGEITYKDVLKVQPFANSICVVTLSGSELKQYLEIAANKKAGSGAFAQFDNVVIEMSGSSVAKVSVGGKEVMDSGSYKLAINSFAASGGDGYMKVSNHPSFVDTGFIDADVLREYVQSNSPLNPADFAPTDDVIR